MDWKTGDRLTHRFNRELGPGLVRAVESRTVLVEFPAAATTLRLAANSEALRPFAPSPGFSARMGPTGETVAVLSIPTPGRVLLADGREVDEHQLWPAPAGETLVERLAEGQLDDLPAFAIRLASLRLGVLREAEGLGSFLGGRIRLFPHQLYVAERATLSDPVRWLLADEVGLGKTVEACLILNHLVRTSRAERTLVVAPETLVVQWLGELWRKYHQVFVLLDDARLADVARDYGAGFNPFDVYRQVVIGLEFLRDRPHLVEQAQSAGIDLLIVDEAHHLRRPAGHPGNLEYRAIRPIADLGRHVLLLTATPLEENAHGYFRLLQLLRPEEFPEDTSFDERLARGEPLPPCTSATRRVDVGGLPPRVALPVDLPPDPHAVALERAIRALPTPHAVASREKLRKLRAGLAAGTALDGLLARGETELRELCRAATISDPRLTWLTRQAPLWRGAGDKTLIFVAERAVLEHLRAELSRIAQLRTGVFHEDLSPAQRDIEVAQFRLPGGPSLLVSTECGGEGRNFEFCTRLVLFDLPWNPRVVEQRIGRLDRIGRNRPVDVVYFRPAAGFGATVAELYETLGLFREPMGGIEAELGRIEERLEDLALGELERPPVESFDDVLTDARQLLDRVRVAAFRELHRAPYRPELARSILDRVPEELEARTREVALATCEHLGLHVEEHQGGSRHSIEFGRGAKVDSLPGVPGGASFLGTFSREEAVADESIDFFSSGHPLVEGLLSWLDDAPFGRVATLRGTTSDAPGFGLVAVYKEGRRLTAVACDAAGHDRPAWASWILAGAPDGRRLPTDVWSRQADWASLIRGLAARFGDRGSPVVLAALWMMPSAAQPSTIAATEK